MHLLLRQTHWRLSRPSPHTRPYPRRMPSPIRCPPSSLLYRAPQRAEGTGVIIPRTSWLHTMSQAINSLSPSSTTAGLIQAQHTPGPVSASRFFLVVFLLTLRRSLAAAAGLVPVPIRDQLGPTQLLPFIPAVFPGDATESTHFP